MPPEEKRRSSDPPPAFQLVRQQLKETEVRLRQTEAELAAVQLAQSKLLERLLSIAGGDVAMPSGIQDAFELLELLVSRAFTRFQAAELELRQVRSQRERMSGSVEVARMWNLRVGGALHHLAGHAAPKQPSDGVDAVEGLDSSVAYSERALELAMNSSAWRGAQLPAEARTAAMRDALSKAPRMGSPPKSGLRRAMDHSLSKVEDRLNEAASSIWEIGQQLYVAAGVRVPEVTDNSTTVEDALAFCGALVVPLKAACQQREELGKMFSQYEKLQQDAQVACAANIHMAECIFGLAGSQPAQPEGDELADAVVYCAAALEQLKSIVGKNSDLATIKEAILGLAIRLYSCSGTSPPSISGSDLGEAVVYCNGSLRPLSAMMALRSGPVGNVDEALQDESQLNGVSPVSPRDTKASSAVSPVSPRSAVVRRVLESYGSAAKDQPSDREGRGLATPPRAARRPRDSLDALEQRLLFSMRPNTPNTPDHGDHKKGQHEFKLETCRRH